MNEILISEFMRYVNRKEAVIAVQVYLELCEIKKYFDITYSFNSTLNKITILAKKHRNESAYIFIPITIYENLTFFKIQNILEAISQQTMFLVIVHSDSTCVYYQLTNALVQPIDNIAKHLKENKQDKLDSDLKRNRQLIEQGALFGLKVTIKKHVKDETKVS